MLALLIMLAAAPAVFVVPISDPQGRQVTQRLTA